MFVYEYYVDVYLYYFHGCCLMSTGLFYYTLGNLDPVLRSSLKNIHLLCVAKYELIKKYGIEQVMTAIVEALLELEKVTCYSVTMLFTTHKYELKFLFLFIIGRRCGI